MKDDFVVAIAIYPVEGEWGQERRSELSWEAAQQAREQAPSRKRTPLTGCHEVIQPSALQGHYWVPLLPGHGYLDGGVWENNNQDRLRPVTLHKPDATSVPLGLQRRDIFGLEWYAFNNQYLGWAAFNRDKREWKASNCEPVHWISPAGQVTNECLPYGPWAERASLLLRATKEGYLLISHAMKSDLKPGVAGIYLIQSGESTKLLDGLVHSPAVSPSGCKVAFAHAPNLEAIRVGGVGRRTLKLIDVCRAA